jgi:hypothetical protein
MLTLVFHTKPVAGGTTTCSASKGSHRSLVTLVRSVPVCRMRTSWICVGVGSAKRRYRATGAGTLSSP